MNLTKVNDRDRMMKLVSGFPTENLDVAESN